MQQLNVSFTYSDYRISIMLEDEGSISIEPGVTFSESEASLIAGAAAAVAGQGCLAQELRCNFPMSEAQAAYTKSIAQILYDSHAFAQQKPFMDVKLTAASITTQPVAVVNKTKKCVLLWSGGKDSLAALLVLRANGYDVTGIHATANFSVKETELQAALALAEMYKLPLHFIKLDWDVMRTFIRNNSNSYDEFPVKNTIPHGRDFILATIAAVVAKRIGASYVCTGFEKELWHETFMREGREVVRFDMHSAKAAKVLNIFLRETMGIGFFSPVAAYSEFVIERHLTLHEPAAWDHISSCFWGRWCGKCIKCLKYALIQEALGKPLIPFQSSPLVQDNPMLLTLIDSLANHETHYWHMKVYCVAVLFERGFFHSMPVIVAKLAGFTVDKQALLAEIEQIVPTGIEPEGFKHTFTG